MSNKFWSSLTEEIIQLFEDREIIETTEKNHERKQTFKFYKACKTGNVELVNSYLENGYDPCEYSNSAIRIANEKGCIAVVDRLLQDKRVDPYTVYTFTKKYCYKSIVDRLQQEIQNRENVNQ